MDLREFMDEMDKELFSQEQLQEAEKWFEENAEKLCADGGSILNNDRKHNEHRDLATTQTLDGQCEEDEYIDQRLLKAIADDRGLLDKIFSEHWEDLHELVTDEKISMAIKNLNDYQKQVLFWNIIQEYTTAEIAENFGVTDRAIRDVRQRALVSIRKEIGAPLDIRYTRLKKIERTYRQKLKDAI